MGAQEKSMLEGNGHAESGHETVSASAPGLLSVMLSVLAAAFGVQSEDNRRRDFISGNPLAFIFAGVIFTVLFVVALLMIVSLVLPG